MKNTLNSKGIIAIYVPVEHRLLMTTCRIFGDTKYGGLSNFIMQAVKEKIARLQPTQAHEFNQIMKEQTKRYDELLYEEE